MSIHRGVVYLYHPIGGHDRLACPSWMLDAGGDYVAGYIDDMGDFEPMLRIDGKNISAFLDVKHGDRFPKATTLISWDTEGNFVHV